MIIEKKFEMFCIELHYGNRQLKYNNKSWTVHYIYKDKKIEKDISVERWWKALNKWHKHISLYGDFIKPLMHIEEYKNTLLVKEK